MKDSEAPLIIWKNSFEEATIAYSEKEFDPDILYADFAYYKLNEFITISKLKISKLKYHNFRFYISGSYRGDNYFFSIPAKMSNIDMELIKSDILRFQPDEFYIYDEWIYFTVAQGLYRTSLDMVDVERIFDYNIKTINSLFLPDSHSFLILNEYIYYINGSDNNKIYCYDMKTKTNEKIYDVSSLHIDIWKNSLMIINNNRNTVVYHNREIIDFETSLDNSFAFFNGATVRKKFYTSYITNNFGDKEIILGHYSWEELENVYSAEEECYLLARYFHENSAGDYAPVEEEEMNIYRIIWKDVNRLDDEPIIAELIYSADCTYSHEYFSGFTVLTRADYMALDI